VGSNPTGGAILVSHSFEGFLIMEKTYEEKLDFFYKLSYEQSVARLKVTLDELQGRETSSPVHELANLKIQKPKRSTEDFKKFLAGLSKDEIFSLLRREIQAARLMVTLDEQLGRETSETVLKLSKMKLPPLIKR
jgi:hypothetical protein